MMLLMHADLVHAQCTNDSISNVNYATERGIHCFDDYTHLMDHMMRPGRRNQTMRIVQARNNMETPMSRHNQYYNACFFFATASIIEYMGYSRFVHHGNFNVDMWYMTISG